MLPHSFSKDNFYFFSGTAGVRNTRIAPQLGVERTETSVSPLFSRSLASAAMRAARFFGSGIYPMISVSIILLLFRLPVVGVFAVLAHVVFVHHELICAGHV